MKTTRAVLTALLISASLVTPKAHASALGQKEKPVIAAGDHAVVTYRLSGFDPSNLNVRGAKALAVRLADAELTRLKQQELLLSHAYDSAKRAADHGSSRNPLLKMRAAKAASQAHGMAEDLARIGIEMQRMEILKKAARGVPLTELEMERVRLHEFKTLRSVSNAADVSEVAVRAIQKEAALFGAKVTAVEKFSPPAWAEAMKLQAKTRMKVIGGVGVAVGVAVFVLYSDYEIEKTEGELSHSVEYPAPSH